MPQTPLNITRAMANETSVRDPKGWCEFNLLDYDLNRDKGREGEQEKEKESGEFKDDSLETLDKNLDLKHKFKKSLHERLLKDFYDFVSERVE